MPAVNPHVVEQAAPRPTSVYRYYDKYGLLLYVGISIRGPVRNVQHGHSAFWPHVVSQEIDHLPDVASARSRERQLILRHKPPFNVQHNPGHEQSRAVYLAFRESALADLSHVDLWRAFNKRVPLQLARRDTSETFALEFRSSPAAAPLVNRLTLLQRPRPYSDKGNCIGQFSQFTVENSMILGLATLRAADYASAYLKCRLDPKTGTFRGSQVVIVKADADA